MKKYNPAEHQFETNAIHAGQDPDPSTGAITFPIYQTSTYVQEAVGKHKGYEYSRTSNPTRCALEACLASLEGAKYGLCFASGMAAMTNVLSLVKAGDHVIASDDLYGGTPRLFNQVYAGYGIEFTYVDSSFTDRVEAAIKPNTKLVWIETPTNPLLKITEIRAISSLTHRHKLILLVDNTFATPFLQRPLDLGADIVLHSVTKYIAGHADTVGGVVMTSNDAHYERMKFHQNAAGAVMGPFDAFLTMRGVKTLALRVERQCENALHLAQYLEQHPKVERVIYPGLDSHPQKKIAERQMRLGGGIISFEIKGGLNTALQFLELVPLYSLAESLGGVESLIEHPAMMTHAAIPKERRETVGITDGLIRISVGIEAYEDLKKAIDAGFAAI
ncbi:MAG: PLP-dependent aspartate aminotransferase family protein [candidate division Zixibacteria bacterium]|nr:PLP-dependent aspartate aminotransferase family protein [candidate division Zixibacteria bacterium]